MTQWLIDTFVWTGALIVLVLVLRGTVARHFGPQVAYALWALPLVRLVLPPLVLPASLAPVEALPAEAVSAPVAGGEAAFILASAYTPAAPTAPGIDWGLWLAFAWLGGALAFLLWRMIQYRAMRAELLAEARPVGEHEGVRLVETPAVDAPVAFGVFDKVVALPPLFMASPDRTSRDMAIAHELAHHRGHDLLANFAAQPLLALHWFSPLAWAGWRAMRRDQEAACDARVVAGRQADERATYARVIAGFATGRSMALAAPMANALACPVGGSFLGEKSIIHRLRSLTMTDVSSSRRKLGLAAIGAGALVALPLTASVTYAQPEAPEAPEPPAPPEAPEPPEAPLPPDAPHRVVRVERTVTEGDQGQRQHRIVIRHADGTTQVEEFSTPSDADMAEIDAEVARAMAEAQAEMAEAHAALAESRAAREEHRAALAESRRAIDEARVAMPRMVERCDGDEPVRHSTDAEGREITIICRRAIQAQATAGAAMGLRQAQNAIRNAPGMPAEQRDRMIEELQQQIDRMERDEVSFNLAPVAPQPAPRAAQAAVMPVVRIEFKAAPAPAVAPVAYAPVTLWLSGAALDKALIYRGVPS